MMNFSVPPELEEDSLVEPHIDRATLEILFDSVADGVPEIILELIEAFLSESRCRKSDLYRAIKTGDAQLAEISAHSLKSSAATFGAAKLAERYAEIEIMARSSRMKHVEIKLQSLMPIYTQVFTLLSAERDRIRLELPTSPDSRPDAR